MKRLLAFTIATLAIQNNLFAAEAGMPQLDPKYWASQTFWLILVFTILYISISKFYLPKIKNNLEDRENKIKKDIDDANKFKELSETRLKEYERILENAKREVIKISNFSIIYEVIDEAQKIIDGLDNAEETETQIGKAIVKQVFELSDSSKVAGCVIEDGKVTSKAFVRILRNEKIFHECEIQSLRREKNQVKEVMNGLECGIVLSKFNEVIQNDRLEFFVREKSEKKS